MIIELAALALGASGFIFGLAGMLQSKANARKFMPYVKARRRLQRCAECGRRIGAP